MNFLYALVPPQYAIAVRIGVYALVVVILVGFGWFKGYAHGMKKYEEAKVAASLEGVRIVKGRDEVTTKVVMKYVPQIAKQQVVTETIIKEVPVYVPASTSDLPGGFRVLHDAAATGGVPDSSRIPDAAAVPAQDFANTFVLNYGICRDTAIRLRGMQEWVREQGKVK